jgi:hypothetical protein
LSPFRELEEFQETAAPGAASPAAKMWPIRVADSRRSLNPILFLLLTVLLVRPAQAQRPSEQAKPDQNQTLSQGQQIASAVSTVTSTAISPLFGVCLIGVYQYIRTPQSARAALPFYSEPIFWIPIAIVLILVFLKDTIGGAVPLLKKPLDALEVLVLNKASLVLIAFPVMIHQITSLTGVKLTELFIPLEPVAYAADFSVGPSAGHVTAAVVALVAGIIVTFVMWVTGHVLDVLCLLSPFPIVDLLLKGIRNAVVLALAATTVLSPRAGLTASLVLIALGLLVFSKALRFSIMGSYFAWDLLRLMAFGHRATPIQGDGVMGFSVGKVAGLPRHTLGRLICGENGNLVFRYRILGFGPHRRLSLEKANGYRIGCGLLYPSVLLPDRDRIRVQFRLLPRYKGAEDGVRIALGAGEVQDLLLQKGWRRFLNWSEAQMGMSRGAAN